MQGADAGTVYQERGGGMVGEEGSDGGVLAADELDASGEDLGLKPEF